MFNDKGFKVACEGHELESSSDRIESKEFDRKSSFHAESTNDVQKKLEKNAEESRRLRFRITLTTALAGGLPMLACIAIWFALATGGLDESNWGHTKNWGSSIFFCAALMMLGKHTKSNKKESFFIQHDDHFYHECIVIKYLC